MGGVTLARTLLRRALPPPGLAQGWGRRNTTCITVFVLVNSLALLIAIVESVRP